MKFKVFEGESSNGQFYAHIIAGNGKIVWQSEGYEDVRSAFKVCEKTWVSAVKVISGGRILGELAAVPYTKDSLKPKVKA